MPTHFIPDHDYGGVLYQNSRTRLIDIVDGTSTTLCLGECIVDEPTHHVGAIWAGMDYSIGAVYISNCFWSMDGDQFRINGPAAQAFSSHHGGGAFFAFCDGAVRYLRESTDLRKIQALCGRADGVVTDGEP